MGSDAATVKKDIKQADDDLGAANPDASQLETDAKALEQDGNDTKDSITAADPADVVDKKRERAESAYAKAAEVRDKRAALLAAGGGKHDHIAAAGEYDRSADDYGKKAELNKESGETKSAEYEQTLQHQISELKKAEQEFRLAGLTSLADDKKNAAEKIKTDYDAGHTKSRLQLTTDGELAPKK